MSYIPVTPGGTMLVGLAASTEQEAIRRLMKDAAHMPYGTWANFQRRGYTIEKCEGIEPEDPPIWYGSGSGT